MNYGLSHSHITEICTILCRQAAVEAACVYGSRAKGNHTPQSDLDLALEGETVDTATVGRLLLDFDSSSLPIRVDVRLLAGIKNAELLSHIKRVGKVMYRRQKVAP